MKTKAREIIAASTGNILEWYDYVIYGALSPFLAKAFFPAEDPIVSLIVTFAVFGVGFLMRPIGGFLFGHWGDTRGRRTALLISVIAMTIPSFLMGCIPTYAQIGLAAPLLVLALRLTQGLTMGGEFIGAFTFLIESAPPGYKGFITSLASMGCQAGLLIGLVVVKSLTEGLGVPVMHAWGWRIPFWLALAFGSVVAWLRLSLHESSAFASLDKTKRKRLPLVTCLAEHKGPLIQILGLSILTGTAFHTILIYATAYLSVLLKVPLQETLYITVAMGVVALFAVPFFGWVSDQVDRRRMILVVSFLFVVLSYPLNLWTIQEAHHGWLIVCELILVLLLAAYVGVFAGVITQLIPTSLRYSGLAIGYNISMALFAGTAPLIITIFIKITGSPAVPGVYLAITALLSFAAACTIQKNRAIT